MTRAARVTIVASSWMFGAGVLLLAGWPDWAPLGTLAIATLLTVLVARGD